MGRRGPCSTVCAGFGVTNGTRACALPWRSSRTPGPLRLHGKHPLSKGSSGPVFGFEREVCSRLPANSLRSSQMRDEDALCTGSSAPLWAVRKSSQKAFSRRNVRGMWHEYIWPDSSHGTLRTSPRTQDHHPDPQAQYVQPHEHISLPPWPITKQPLPAATEGDQLRNRVQTWQCRAGDLPFGPHPQGCVRCRVMPPAPPTPHLVFRWSWYCFTSPLRG